MAGQTQKEPDDPFRIAVNYIKSNFFRVVHTDGCHGSITPHRQVQMALFSERLPIPQRTVHTVEDGMLSQPVETIGKDGVVREVEVELMMAPVVALSIGQWLVTKATEALALDAPETPGDPAAVQQ